MRQWLNAIYYDASQQCLIVDFTRSLSSGKKRHYCLLIYETGDVNAAVWE